jgi:hypothetical protein
MSRDERKVVVRGAVCGSSGVTGWFSQDFSNGTAATASTARPDKVDVHGFAFNSSVLWDPERWGRYPTSEPDKSQVSRHLITLFTCSTMGSFTPSIAVPARFRRGAHGVWITLKEAHESGVWPVS